jgi:hypothetical protein
LVVDYTDLPVIACEVALHCAPNQQQKSRVGRIVVGLDDDSLVEKLTLSIFDGGTALSITADGLKRIQKLSLSSLSFTLHDVEGDVTVTVTSLSFDGKDLVKLQPCLLNMFPDVPVEACSTLPQKRPIEPAPAGGFYTQQLPTAAQLRQRREEKLCDTVSASTTHKPAYRATDQDQALERLHQRVVKLSASTSPTPAAGVYKSFPLQSLAFEFADAAEGPCSAHTVGGWLASSSRELTPLLCSSDS